MSKANFSPLRPYPEDTSASYGNGHNHELIAKAIKGRREKIVIHSKYGSPRAPDAGGLRGGSSTEYLMKT